MPKRASSPWDFAGELFPVEQTRRMLSVTDLTANVRRILESQIGEIWVAGEISALRLQSSGHIYFTLKDASAQLNCVLFRNDLVSNRADLRDGQKVALKGRVTVYEARGQYQLHVAAVELLGLGALQAQFERLKQKLAAEGLFAPERKRPLPPFPRRLGLVTSPTGAAIRDVLHVVRRRNPSLEIFLAPAAVQGPAAAAEIAAAIALLNQWSAAPGRELDLILITRGGGSPEDLWAFNEEILARAIFHSALPVVSAVGHEIDFSISDFVADLRAATPSAAAEILTEGVFAAARDISQTPARLADLARRRLAAERRHGAQLSQRLLAFHPRRVIDTRHQLLDDLQLSLARGLRRETARARSQWLQTDQRLARLRPERSIARRRESLTQAARALRDRLAERLRDQRHRAAALEARLRLLGPQQTLARGYSITADDATGHILRRADDSRPGQKLLTRLASGQIRSIVEP